MTYQNKAKGAINDLGNLRNIPQSLSAAFLVASAYQFGAVSTISLNWFGGYTLSSSHAMLISLVALAVAFASSKTNRFENYDRVSQVIIAAGPATIVGWQHVQAVQDAYYAIGDPVGAQVALAVVAISWATMLR